LITVKPRHALERDVSSVPQTPFWASTTLSPYRGRARSDLAIDYRQLLAEPGGADLVTIWEGDAETIRIESTPLLIDATGPLEEYYGRGSLLANRALEDRLETSMLICSGSTLEEIDPHDDLTVTLTTWPLDLPAIEDRASMLHARRFQWGLAIPIVYPITTELSMLRRLADVAAANGASYIISIALDIDPAAKQRIAMSMVADEESYVTLFGADLETITVATERHIAALAHERGLSDILLLPRHEERSNWNASVLLSTAGSRMLRMKRDAEEGWRLVRAAKVIAELDKPIERIAQMASLSIIDGVSALAVEIVSEWLQRRPARKFEEISSSWRLRRDYGVDDEESESGE
jgi:hypothetical protein